MAQNTTLNIPANTWTLLTDADVSTVTFANVTGSTVWIKATTDTTEPTDRAGAIPYSPGFGESAAAMTDLFPGLSGADRLWAYSTEPASVFISHA